MDPILNPDDPPRELSAGHLAEIESRAGRLCRCDREECIADVRRLADADVPALLDEVRHLRAGERAHLAHIAGLEAQLRESLAALAESRARRDGSWRPVAYMGPGPAARQQALLEAITEAAAQRGGAR